MSTPPKRARDPELLDIIDQFPKQEFSGSVWRAVRVGRDALEPSRAGGRWDMGTFEVLYTATESDGAIAEVHFHLSRQPVFPSKYDAVLYKINLSATKVLRFQSIDDLEPMGVDPAHYKDVLYGRTQEIGDAAAFLGLDALIAPSARWDCHNLVVLALDPGSMDVVEQHPIDWHAWRALNRPHPSR